MIPKVIEEATRAGLIVKVITYRNAAAGVKVRRKGYDITNPATGHTLRIEPREYRKDSIFATDKWMISQEGQPIQYDSRITKYVKAIM